MPSPGERSGMRRKGHGAIKKMPFSFCCLLTRPSRKDKISSLLWICSFKKGAEIAQAFHRWDFPELHKEIRLSPVGAGRLYGIIVQNNPINFIDPSGLWSPQLLGAGLGLALGQMAVETTVFYIITDDLSASLLAAGYWQAVKLGGLTAIGGVVTMIGGTLTVNPVVVAYGAGLTLGGTIVASAAWNEISEILKHSKEKKNACTSNRK
jgi:hypothetical protein